MQKPQTNASVMQAEAVLPPPFPSLAPHRLYVSNMAVAPAARRRGAARALLRAATRAGARWGEPSAWLHVGAANGGARELYTSAGFRPAHRDAKSIITGLIPGPWSQQLLSMELPDAGGWLRRWAAAEAARAEAEAAGEAGGDGGGGDGGGGEGGSSGGSGGAFQWQRLVAEE